MSSSFVVSTCCTVEPGTTFFATDSQMDSRTTSTFAPESARWYVASFSLNIGFRGTTTAPRFHDP